MFHTLAKSLPWTQSPLIINAPMGGFAGGELAAAVTKAGGLGMIGGVFNMNELHDHLVKATEILHAHHSLDCSKNLPVGVGLLPFISKLEEALPLITEFKPRVLWLFAAKKFEDYATWSQQVREASPDTHIWVQCGSVTAALRIVELCKPDALAMQGADAGGHGFEKGAGIVSLLPETADALQCRGLGHIPLVGAGGIADGRGTAAALALGAQGVVMGTRFLAAKETIVHRKYRAALLDAKDGGQNTVRSKIFDELRGPNIWPEAYDGRSLVTDSYTDHVNGVSIEEIRKLHNEAVKGEDAGFGENKRAVIWAGTGVGLINKVEAAADIVIQVRNAACEALQRVAKF
ncbi:inosine monophosphate dehydrogenase [Glonium stellatum]|uniref:Inosine monophosphate dehydrogenase n=1 Tax=Glonium stellatum TaxID=574774 RepID=A0A8E2JYX9_9PEZI|nr:inosine monophosphate dehydrogenase [Glonium stellatum]